MKKCFPRLIITLMALSAQFIQVPSALAQEIGLGRHKQLYAVPAPGKVTIDGKLDDWDLSGQIEMYVVAEGKETQGAKFALMYDKEALYISGEVRDTSPMMNRHDPAVSGKLGWDADSCQFRLTLDSSKPYPETETVFSYRADSKKIDARDDIKHLTLWYFTDRQEPVLQIQSGMTYRVLPPASEPCGVVSHNKFEAKYLKTTDGLGYTFEYRIPWSTLGAKAPLQGGNIVAGTLQFNWGTPDGLKNGGGAAWAYDVMRGPGFVFQNAGVWGKIIFSGTGGVSRELVEAGVPASKPQPLKFAYKLPRAGQISLQLFDDQNMIRRTLVAQGDRPKGENVESWDGMDDQGKPLPAGTYTVKGIIHDPIKGEFQFSVHNSGHPPYPTEDGKGGWGGDHGVPTAVTGLPDGDMLLSWDCAEYGWAIIRVDAQGRKKWGSKSNSLLLANDGKCFFAQLISFEAGLPTEIGVFDLADGRPLNFGNGKPTLEPPPGGAPVGDTATGLAYTSGKIYVSYGKRNLVGVYDSVSGDLATTWEVPEPGVLAARPDGSLAAISAGKLVVLVEGKISPLSDRNLDTPSGIATGTDGLIYVSNQGKAQDVSVYDSAGKFLRNIGKLGGRPAMGAYDPNGLFYPRGLAVDTQDRLWVAEWADGPKRISVWNAATGAFEKEFFGGCGYAAYAAIDPARPDEIYCHNVLWHIDWDKKTTTPITTVWRKTAPDMMDEPLPHAYPQGFRIFTTGNKHQYGWGMAGKDRKSVFYRSDGDFFKPFLSIFQIPPPNSKKSGNSGLDLEAQGQLEPGTYLWQDQNNDQRVQMSELQKISLPPYARMDIRDIGPDFSIWVSNGLLLKPVKVLENGQPVYDPEKIEKTFLTGTPNTRGYLWLDPDGGVYTSAAGQRPSLAKWNAAGKMEWGYPSITEWNKALGLPVVKAGRLWGMSDTLGVAGSITGNMSYFGVIHLFQRDNGIYVAAIMKDGRVGNAGSGPEAGAPEGAGGSLVRLVTKHGAAPRTFVIAGGQDARVTEVLGLDTIQSLPEWKFTLTAKEAGLASDALADFTAKAASAVHLAIMPGRDSLLASDAASQDFDGAHGFSVRAAYDEKNLYLSYDVTSPVDLINAIPDSHLVFKGGNCLDIQLAADPAADPARKTPAPGDIRLLVTRQLGADGKTLKPYVVLFRPKVKGFTGQPIVLTSPTGKESFDEITVVNKVGLEYRKTPTGFTAVVSIPLNLIGFTPKAGVPVKMDLGYVFGNSTGNQVGARSYLKNRSFSANVVNDVPNESRLEPKEWDEIPVK